MLNYILNLSDYEKQKKRIVKLFRTDLQFHENLFRPEFKHFIAFEFDFIYNTFFFEGIKNYLKTQNLSEFIYYTLIPSPDEYFYKHFSKYNICIIPIETTDEELNEFLMRDPGGSPTDALAINSQEIVLFSGTDKWGILASRDWELAIAGFTSSVEKDNFVKAFKESSDMFFSIKEQVEIFEKMLDLSKSKKDNYKKLIENYQKKVNK